MQMEQAAAYIVKKKKLLAGSYLVPYFTTWRKIKEIALFQYQIKIDYFGENFRKGGLRPEKKLQLMVFVWLWFFGGEICCFY